MTGGSAGSGAQLFFIHGSGACGAVWHHQLRAFPGAVAVDLPGHPEGALLASIEAYADWLQATVAARGAERVVLVGHSIGGGIALAYALTHPQDLAGIVLVGSGARLRVLPQTLELLERAVAAPRLLRPLLAQAWERVEPALAETLIDTCAAIGAAAFLSDLQACDRFDVMQRLDAIATPTLALCGSDDAMTPPKYSHFLASRIAGARVEIIPGGTHMVFAEQPEAVNRAIAGFLAELESSGAVFAFPY